jgi:outer membrane protein
LYVGVSYSIFVIEINGNMKYQLKTVVTILFLNSLFAVFPQQKPIVWTLRNTIDYALKNNIQIQKSKLNKQVNEETYKQAKSSIFPTISVGVSESFSNIKDSTKNFRYNQSFISNYSINSSLTLFNGFKTSNNIKEQKLCLQTGDLAIKVAENNIEITITETYLQILFARESVRTSELTLEISKSQMERGQLLYDAGSISQSDYSQLQSQYSKDSYTLIGAKNTFETQVLNLKQLLEFGINDTIDLYYPEIVDSDVIAFLPPKKEVYETALSFLPEIETNKINIKIAEYDLEKSTGDLYPSLSLSAGVLTGSANNDKESYGTQLNNNLYQDVVLSLNINIFNQRTIKTNIAKSKIAIEVAKLNSISAEKDLLKTVESVYLDVVSSQNRFIAATEGLKSAKLTYELVENEFNLGMKNTFEFLSQKNAYLTAQQEYLQAKYATILNQKLLDFYQNRKINL